MSAHAPQTAATIDRMIESADRLEIADWSTSPSDLWSGRTVLTISLQGCPWRCTPTVPTRVVLDVRAPATRYRAATGAGSGVHKVFASLRSVLESGVELQVRSTIDPDVVSPVELERLVADLVAQGVGDHVVIERRGTERPAVPVRRVPVGSGRVPSRG